MSEWRIFKLNDCDWYVGKSLEDAKAAWQADCGPMPDDEAFDEPYELSDEDMDTLKIADADDPKAPRLTFRKYLEQNPPIRAEMFASTEY